MKIRLSDMNSIQNGETTLIMEHNDETTADMLTNSRELDQPRDEFVDRNKSVKRFPSKFSQENSVALIHSNEVFILLILSFFIGLVLMSRLHDSCYRFSFVCLNFSTRTDVIS